MNFDRINRAKASASALLRRDKSAAKMVVVGQSATVGRVHTPRADRKIGRVRLCRTLDRSIKGSTESHPTLLKSRGAGNRRTAPRSVRGYKFPLISGYFRISGEVGLPRDPLGKSSQSERVAVGRSQSQRSIWGSTDSHHTGNLTSTSM